MASLDFELEKNQFREFFELNMRILEDAKNSFVTLINALITHNGNISVSKLEGRVKDKEECIRKFTRKYRTSLEKDQKEYSIRENITDLIGLRIVCLYEDDIDKVKNILSQHFDIIDITDKTAQIEETDNLFGYKGLHLDLRLNNNRRDLPEYHKYSDFQFEVQIRTIIQDSWSVLDHKIKYKKSIPNKLKRRINTLAALFELADREFREIRDSTNEEIQKAESSTVEEIENEEREENSSEEATASLSEQDHALKDIANFTYQPLNAFDFLKIAKHFFGEYEFEAYKVDGFVQEIIGFKSNITRGKFNFYMKESISKVKYYNKTLNEMLNPFTVIRHCLYLGDKEIFENILTNSAKENFEEWLKSNT